MTRPCVEELLELIAAARNGDGEAYRSIQEAWSERLVSLLCRLTDGREADMRKVAGWIFAEQRERILRSGGEGGYTLEPVQRTNRARQFHTYILMECTDWGRALVRDPKITAAHVRDMPDQIDTKNPSPRESFERKADCEELFALVCNPRAGYPHQQLTFLFSKYLFGHGRNESQGDALRTDAECGPVPLRDLVCRLEQELSFLDDQCPTSGKGVVGRALLQLRRRLALTVGEMFGEMKDTQAAQRHADLLGKLVGDTCLHDYFPAHPEHDAADRRQHTQDLLADWCRKVTMRLRALLGVVSD